MNAKAKFAGTLFLILFFTSFVASVSTDNSNGTATVSNSDPPDPTLPAIGEFQAPSTVHPDEYFLLSAVVQKAELDLPPESWTNLVGTNRHYPRISRRASFSYLGIYWFFYSAGGTLYLSTSLDSENWSSGTAICGTYNVESWSIAFNGTHVAIALNPDSSCDKIYFRLGVPQSDRTISWCATQQTVYSGGYWSCPYPNISLDAYGYAYIICDYSDRPYAFKNAKRDGTWEHAAGFPITLTTYTSDENMGAIIPLDNGGVLAIWSWCNEIKIQSRYYNGTEWEPEQFVTGSNSVFEGEFSAVAVVNDVFLTWQDYNTTSELSTIESNVWNFTTKSWGSASHIHEQGTSIRVAGSPVITKHAASNNLTICWRYAYWVYNPSPPPTLIRSYLDHLVTRDDYDSDTGTWGGNYTWVSASETQENDLSAYYQTYDDGTGAEHFGVYFYSGTGTWIAVNSKPAIQFVNATVELSNDIILQWEYDSDTFSEAYDPNDYCALDSLASYKSIVNSTSYRLTWKIKLEAHAPTGDYDVVTAHTTVYDSLGDWGTNSHNDLFTLEAGDDDGPVDPDGDDDDDDDDEPEEPDDDGLFPEIPWWVPILIIVIFIIIYLYSTYKKPKKLKDLFSFKKPKKKKITRLLTGARRFGRSKK